MSTQYGSTWAELSKLAGQDSKAIVVLSHLLDAAENDEQVDIPVLREFCAEPTSLIDDKSMNWLLAEIVSYIVAWRDETDEPTVADFERAILAALFSLRTGRLACWTCLDTAWHLGLLRPREPHWVDCQRHHALSVYDIVAPRTPILRAVPYVA